MRRLPVPRDLSSKEFSHRRVLAMPIQPNSLPADTIAVKAFPPAAFIDNDVAREIYEGLAPLGVLDAWEEWIARVRILYRARRGGIALVADAQDPEIWWIDLYTPRALPRLDKLRGLIVFAQLAGAHYLAAHATIASARLGERMGFQRINDKVFSLKLI